MKKLLISLFALVAFYSSSFGQQKYFVAFPGDTVFIECDSVANLIFDALGDKLGDKKVKWRDGQICIPNGSRSRNRRNLILPYRGWAKSPCIETPSNEGHLPEFGGVDSVETDTADHGVNPSVSSSNSKATSSSNANVVINMPTDTTKAIQPVSKVKRQKGLGFISTFSGGGIVTGHVKDAEGTSLFAGLGYSSSQKWNDHTYLIALGGKTRSDLGIKLKKLPIHVVLGGQIIGGLNSYRKDSTHVLVSTETTTITNPDGTSDIDRMFRDEQPTYGYETRSIPVEVLLLGGIGTKIGPVTITGNAGANVTIQNQSRTGSLVVGASVQLKGTSIEWLTSINGQNQIRATFLLK